MRTKNREALARQCFYRKRRLPAAISILQTLKIVSITLSIGGFISLAPAQGVTEMKQGEGGSVAQGAGGSIRFHAR